ncbi:glycosyl transferase [Mycobacterium adipatum]|uniref:Glycosyl transferase n=2 Tax=Mycobacterium adipatum TaxID=1682113 RepID=A0A172UKQ1_9MYCO|nr:glycosyltransferase family 39 protein [Mycobacterium adipatum]ANE79673.1 glycosyl transferase [Mycobacterium adipatum]MBI5738083.1 glycosyltransferase family 39 protein [Mycolicibacterium neoaurum]
MTMTAEVQIPPEQVVPGVHPRWERPGLLALLAGTAALYLWGLGSGGWANSYYAAAAQAGTQDWKAWLFGSFDAGNAITVDKPPAALWAMALSGRVFGFNEFTMLLPQALMGVAAVAVLFGTVRRTSGPAAGLIAGAVLALTPVAALMFRYNNPDALLVLLLVVAAYCMVRATQQGSMRWVALSGGAVGFAFLTKMLQAFLVVPALSLVFLVAAPMGFWKRVGALLVALVSAVVSAGWYIALVSLWPTDARPYIAGSSDNSLLQLAFGYNGVDRIVGRGQPGGGAGPGGPGGGGANLFFGGDPGVGRLFGASMGAEASWLLPAALLGLVAVLWLTRRAARTDMVRAATLMWGTWLLVTGAVFSFMDGTIHPYYTVALAPAIAALVGISSVELWHRRHHPAARAVLALSLVGTGGWAFVLLGRNPDWWPVLRWSVLIASVVVAAVLAFGVQRLGRSAEAVLVAAALLAGGAGSAGWALATVADGNSGGPMAVSGPATQQHEFGPGGHTGRPGGPGTRVDDTALAELVTGLDNRWAAATVGSMMAGDLELKSGASIMSIGGFAGGDNSPTLQQFQDYVAAGDVRYFIAGERFGPGGHRDGSGTQITEWVQQHFATLDVGGTTVYDLSRPLR